MQFDFLRLRTDTNYRAELTDWVAEEDDLREAGRLICKTNLLALCYVLGYTRIDPEVHREALEFFIPRDLSKPVSRQGEGQKPKGTLLYPRGTFKTTLDEADIVQECLCFPKDGITFVVCATAALAEAIVRNVRAHFVKSAHAHPTLLQALFPELCLYPSQAKDMGSFSLPGRQTFPPIKENLVMAFSVEGGVSGWHCWRLKGDDIANNRNMESEGSRAKCVRNYNINRKMLNAGGIEDKLGTRYAPDDPYGVELTKSRPGSYRYVVKPALRLKNGTRLDPNGFPPEAEMDLLFAKTGLTYDVLRDEYDADYSSFMTQYMNDDHGDNEVVFPAEELTKIFRDEEQMPLDGDVSIRWRMPCKGLGWKFACGVVGAKRDNRMHIIDAIYGAYKPSALAEKVVELARKHDIHTVSIEASPGANKLGPLIDNFALVSGYPLNLTWSEHEPDEGERDVRIKTCESLMSATRLLISADLKLTRKIFEQFSSYGMTNETSFPDVISRLAEALPKSIAARREDLMNEGLAFQMAAERDMWNMVHGGVSYAPVEVETEPEEIEEPNPWGLDDVIPGLNT